MTSKDGTTDDGDSAGETVGNEVSGLVDGPVVQAQTVLGGIHFHAAPDSTGLAPTRPGTREYTQPPQRRSPVWLASYPVDLTGHTKPISTIAFSPDGHTLASAAHDRTIRLWEVPSGRPIATWVVDDKSIRALCFSTDGRTLATGMRRSVRLWDVATGAVTATLAHSDQVVSVTFSPDGATLASCMDFLKTVRLRDGATGREVRSLSAPAGTKALAFSPDGQALAVACRTAGRTWDGTIRLWDLNAGPSFRDLSGTRAKPVSHVSSVALSPDGKTLAAAVYSAEGIILWDAASGLKIGVLGDLANAVAFHPDGRTLVARDLGGGVRLFDLVSSGQSSVLEAPSSAWFGTCALALSPDGRSLAVPGRNVIRLWSDRG